MIRLFEDNKGRRAEYGEWVQNGHHEWWAGRRVPLALAEEKYMNLIACEVFDQLSRQTGCEVEVAVCGGYARDVFYGRKPKDIDIFVHLGPHCGEGEAFRLAEEVCLWARESHGMRVGVSQAYSLSAGHNIRGEDVSFDERHYAIAQLDLDELSIDVLFTRAATVQETLEKFDCNLNQVYLDELGGPAWLHGNPPTNLVFNRQVSAERSAKLQRIAREVSIHEG